MSLTSKLKINPESFWIEGEVLCLHLSLLEDKQDSFDYNAKEHCNNNPMGLK